MAERARYFDGEFLRSGDFTDEQSYHVAMRRLLNQELHLHGIVKGLHIDQDQNSVPNTPAQFYSVTPGFAIDQIGREIYVTAPYSLTPLLSRAGLKLVTYELWIVYTETPSGSPAPGYRLCDQPSQNTRWTESFALMLRDPGVAPDPNAPDPNLDLKGICLGLISVKYDSTVGWYFSAPSDWYRRRTYARVRAQAIIAPDDVDPDYVTLIGPNNFPPPPEGYIHIRTNNGVYAEGNLIVRNNLLVGDDWTIANANPAIPVPGPTNLNGNLKLNSDIFLRGQIYTNPNGTWVALSSYINDLVSSLLPSVAADVQVLPTTPATIPISGVTGGAFTFTTPLPLMSTLLPSFSKVDVQAYVCGVQFADPTTWVNWASGSFQTGFQVTASASPQSGSSGTPVTITVSCSVLPIGNNFSVFESINVAGVVIFRP